jgi:hypothetical protein
VAKPGFSSDTFTVDSGVVGGQTIAKWTQDWWTWALNSSTTDSPFTQPDGTHVAANHNDDGGVFFIAGVQQSAPFDVPLGKALLVPVINFIDTAPELLPNKNKADPNNPSFNNAIHATENANIKADDASLSGLFAKVDGVSVPNLASYLVDSSFFDPGTAQPGKLAMDYFGLNPFEGTPLGPAKSGGAWLMLDNLTPGSHTLDFGGHSSAFGGFDLHVIDHINVV